ncbi:MAG: hypothetical protein IJ001_03610 [Oscillospiraceae bacterium]|nr:hypothetical protein [Oscillospiraceae bacterium]
MDIGLNVDFDGKKNTVLEGDVIKEYPIGGMACEYARLRPTEIKPLILSNTFFQDADLRENGGHALSELYEACLAKFGVITAVMILTDFSSFMADFNRANEDELKGLIDPLNADKDTNQIKSFILKESGYDDFGIATIGQAMLSAYAAYADSYVVFKHSFNMLVSGEEYEENQVMGFWGLYASNIDFQHIDFHIMFYDNSFHSIYTIKSSMSLILFEAAHAMDAGTKFVKCKNCGNYFVPVGRSDSVYCGYPSPQDETKECRVVGANATRARKMKNDTMTQEYRRLYMRLKMAIKRHPDDEVLKKRFTELTEGMKARKQQKEEGTISVDSILDWLTAFDNTLNGN